VGNKLAKLINLCLEKNIPFVTFRNPDEETIYTWILLSGKFNFYESFNEVAGLQGFVYAPFHRRTNFPIVFFEPELVIENENFEGLFLNEIKAKEPVYPEYSFESPVEISKEVYLDQAEGFIRSFDNEFIKAVLSRIHLEKKPKQFDTGLFFINLQKKYPRAFCHLINIPGTGTWAGATPETLLRIDGNIAQTISLAGTQPFTGSNEPLLWQEKELEEQKIVTDYVEDVLQSIGVREFKKEKIKNVLAGNAIHLATKFVFDQSGIKDQLGSFITELHPTPAVCGLPKDKAIDLIFSSEKHNREYYSGFCGMINMNGNTDLFVNLRCMKILKDKFALFVGGGLTRLSTPEIEWEETRLKAETLFSVL
jgi:isochorismate synthase